VPSGSSSGCRSKAATALFDARVNGARAGDLASASLVSSTRFIELDAAVWLNNTVRVMARTSPRRRSIWRRRRCGGGDEAASAVTAAVQGAGHRKRPSG
jgi:hypothetical protein